MSVRPAMRWALAGTVGLSLVAVLQWPARDSAPPAGARAAKEWSSTAAMARTPPALVPSPALPAHLPPMEFQPAERDLFASTPLPAPVQVKAPPPAPVPVQAPPPPPPPPPPMTAHYLGRFRTPDGQQLIYLRDGDRTVLASPGAALRNCYAVEQLRPAASAPGAEIVAVQMLHAARDHRQTLRLPEVP